MTPPARSGIRTRVSAPAHRVPLLAAVVVAVGLGVTCERKAEPAAPSPAAPTSEAGAALPPLPATALGFPVTHGAAAGYIADQACKTCHEGIYEDYQSVGMAHSFYPPDPTRAVEPMDQEFHHKATGYRYRMSVQDGRYVLTRHCVDDEGKRFAELSVPVDWVIGSGNKVRSYLSQNGRGELFHLPISWYRESGWQMSPGFDRENHQRFERQVDRGCMFCHNAYPQVPVGNDLPHRSDRFPKKLPHGIGCQRCHGPGARHALAAEDEDADEATVRGLIKNPANMNRQQQEDVCMACHLQPESVRSRMMVRAFDKGIYAWQPGEDLARFITYLDHGSAKERGTRFEINHHAYRLRQSACYVESGELTCVTCHDPHSKPPAEERAAFYRNKCATCHQPNACKSKDPAHTKAPRESNCVSCHMAPARPSDVVHVTVTDHKIRRRRDPQRAAPRTEHAVTRQPLSILPYFPKRYQADPLYPVHEGFGRAYFPTPVSNKLWRKDFENTKPHTVTGYVNVGRGLLETGDHESATEVLIEAVKRFPQDAAAHWSLGAALLTGKHTSAAIAQLEKALRLDTTDPGIQATLASAYRQAGDHVQARLMYQRALAGRPESADTWREFAFTLLQSHDLMGALDALNKAIARNPRDPYSYAIAASVLQSQRRIPEQFAMLRQGASLLPQIEIELVAAELLTASPKFHSPTNARARIASLVERFPKDSRVQLHRALVEVLTGEKTAADQALKQAAEGGSDRDTLTLLRAVQAFRSGATAAGRKILAPLERTLNQPRREQLFGALVSYSRRSGWLE